MNQNRPTIYQEQAIRCDFLVHNYLAMAFIHKSFFIFLWYNLWSKYEREKEPPLFMPIPK